MAWIAAHPGTDLHVLKADFFRALAHPIRIRILELLASGDRSVQELQRVRRLEQPLVSQQLSILRARNIDDMLRTARAIFDNHLVGTQSMLRQLRQERKA